MLEWGGGEIFAEKNKKILFYCFDTSLADGNKEKLAEFYNFLLQENLKNV